MALLKNILFVALILAGLAAMGASLVPSKSGRRVAVVASPDGEFKETVTKVDEAFATAWARDGIQPALPADALTVARRLSLGLTGTIPSLEEIRKLEELPEGDRLDWWISHLLHDRRYADFVAERFARAFVGTENGPFIFFRRRKFVLWLAAEIARNRPYDQIVRDLITTEGLWTDKPATNFITVTIEPDNKEKQNQPDPVRLAGRVTRAFLGIRLDCAQCHDHPFADWKQGDFEGFAAFFGQTRVGFRGVHDGSGEFKVQDRKTREYRVVEPRVARAADLLPVDGPLRRRLATWVTHQGNPWFAKATVNRVWAILCGQPLVTPIDNLEAAESPPEALAILADDFARNGHDLARLVRIIASTRAFRHESISRLDSSQKAEKTWASFPLTRLRPEQVAGSVIQAASISTIDAESHLVTRLMRFGEQNDFVKRYGDSGDDEFDGRGGTIPQRLVMMNGKLVQEKTRGGPFNTTTRVEWLAGSDESALEALFLATLTRRPDTEERDHFTRSLADRTVGRGHGIQDIFWALVNSTEFSWNH